MTLKDPVLLASEIDLLKPSAIIKNNKVDIGQPCSSPLVCLENLEVDLFIKTAEETEDKQPIIQFTIYRTQYELK